MPGFEDKYSREQAEAVVFAYLDRNLSAARVSQLAKTGELTGRDGQSIEAFDIPINTVRSKARTAKKQRAGDLRKGITDVPHRDAIESLRRTLLAACAESLDDEMAKRAKDRDLERLRQIARAVREAAAIPDKNEPRPPAPGAKQNGKREGAETTGGLAGGILAAHRAAHEGSPTEPATPTPSLADDERDTSTTDDTTRSDTTNENTITTHDDGSPGFLVRELAGELAGGA